MIRNNLVLALREIRRNVMRSFLTILGVVIGVAAVIIMVTIGNGATVQITRQISALGSNLLIVTPGKRVMGPPQPGSSASFRLADTEEISREISSIVAVAPSSSRSITAIVGNENWTTRVTGTDNGYFKTGNWVLEEGREFNPGELQAGTAVCIIGMTVRTKLFGGQSPLGREIRLKKFSCRVVGLLKSKGQSMMGMDQDDTVVIPIRTLHRRIAGNQNVDMVFVKMQEGAMAEHVQRDIELLLRERRHIATGQEDDFGVMDMKEISKTLTGTTQVLTSLLSAVAAVSLLVGGIGIMNIMLVSVTERTREIGTRLAIGAMERDVLLQFLIEAITLSSLGGLIGIVLAIAVSFWLVGMVNVPFVFKANIVIVAFLFSMAMGVIFGFFPALKAARLDPIDALRYE